jgi:hypothetical protein
MNLEKSNVRFTLIEPGVNKLSLVKAILSLKHLTGWGLKQSKDFVDSTDEKYNKYAIARPGVLELPLTKIELESFRESLENCDKIKYELTDYSKLRNKKLIQLGLYDKTDLINELVDEDLFNILRNKDFDTIKALLIERYSNLPENYLKEKLSI